MWDTTAFSFGASSASNPQCPQQQSSGFRRFFSSSGGQQQQQEQIQQQQQPRQLQPGRLDIPRYPQSHSSPVFNDGTFNNVHAPPQPFNTVPSDISSPLMKMEPNSLSPVVPGPTSSPSMKMEPNSLSPVVPGPGYGHGGFSASAAQSPAAWSHTSADERRNGHSPGAQSNGTGNGNGNGTGGKRTGRPPKWDPRKTRQLIRNYIWSNSRLIRTIQLFHMDDHPDEQPLRQAIPIPTEDQAKRQSNGAQKKLNTTIGKDPRKFKARNVANGTDTTELNELAQWRLNPPARTEAFRRRHMEEGDDGIGNGVAYDQYSPFFPERQMTMTGTFSRTVSGLSTQSKIAFKLLKNLTIKSEPEGPLSRQGTGIRAATFSLPTLICPLPGDLLTMDSRISDPNYAYYPGDHHSALTIDTLWSELRPQPGEAEPNLWAVPSGLSTKGKAALLRLANTPALVDLSETDCFGNTLLHLLAARRDLRSQLLGIFKKQKVPVTIEHLALTNTARQTFLHVLARDWFVANAEGNYPLFELQGAIEKIDPTTPMFKHLVPLRDVYGHTLFHHIKYVDGMTSEKASDMIHAIIVMAGCESDVFYFRDAFGCMLVDSPHSQLPHRESVSGAIVPSDGTNVSYRPYTPLEVGSEAERFEHIVQRALKEEAGNDDIYAEDGEGSGALHCLAGIAAVMPLAAPTGKKRKASECPAEDDGGENGHLQGKPGARGGSQSRHSTPYDPLSSGVASPSSVAAPGGAVGTPGPTATAAGAGAGGGTTEDPGVADICRKLRELLNKGCSPSHYDRRGNTALMTFVEILPDNEVFGQVFNILVEYARKEGLLEARNRDGETALSMATRLGRPFPTKALVGHGASQHGRSARHGRVRSLLQTVRHELGKGKHDVQRVAKLEACMSELGRNGGHADKKKPESVMFPDVIDEWGVAWPEDNAR